MICASSARLGSSPRYRDLRGTIVGEAVVTLATPEYFFQAPPRISHQDPITVVATLCQSRVGVARSCSRPHVHKTRASRVLPLYFILSHTAFVR